MYQINWTARYYYDDLIEFGKYLEKQYPAMVSFRVIGCSHDGRDIFMLKAGCGTENIILTGGVHGRETVNPIVLMAMIQDYCEHKNDWMERYSLYTVPLLNPDGYMIALRGFNIIRMERLRLAIKSKGIPYYLWKYNARGIDINRNFPSKTWQKKHRSDQPASEQETRALIRLFEEVPSIGYIDYHSRGKSIYYYRGSMDEVYNTQQYHLAGKLCMASNYMLVPRQDEIEAGDSGGNTVHFYSENTYMPAFTIETVEEEAVFPLKTCCQEPTFHEIVNTPFILMEK